MLQDSSPPDVQDVGEDDSDYFRFVHGRSLNALNTTYMLPVDEDEIKVNFVSFSRPSVGWLIFYFLSAPNCIIGCYNSSFKERITWGLSSELFNLASDEEVRSWPCFRYMDPLIFPVLDLGTGAGHW